MGFKNYIWIPVFFAGVAAHAVYSHLPVSRLESVQAQQTPIVNNEIPPYSTLTDGNGRECSVFSIKPGEYQCWIEDPKLSECRPLGNFRSLHKIVLRQEFRDK